MKNNKVDTEGHTYKGVDDFIDGGITTIVENSNFEEQSLICMEECSELIQALSKFKRIKYLDKLNFSEEDKEKYNHAYDNIVEEIADVEIVVQEIKQLLCIQDEEIKAVKFQKIARQLKRLGLNVYVKLEDFFKDRK